MVSIGLTPRQASRNSLDRIDPEASLEEFFRLKVQYYARYVDDFVIVHRDLAYLKKLQLTLSAYLANHFELKIHPKKIVFRHYTKGIDFLGATIKPYRMYISNRTKHNFKKYLSGAEKYFSDTEDPDPESLCRLMAGLNSYIGIMKHYRTYNIKKTLLDKSAIFKYGYIKTIPHKSMKYILYQTNKKTKK